MEKLSEIDCQRNSFANTFANTPTTRINWTKGRKKKKRERNNAEARENKAKANEFSHFLLSRDVIGNRPGDRPMYQQPAG